MGQLSDDGWVSYLMKRRVNYLTKRRVSYRDELHGVDLQNLIGSFGGIVWIMRTGAPWRDLPKKFGSWNSIYNKFNKWSKTGFWQFIWDCLKEDIDNQDNSIDASIIKAHQDACR